MEDENGGVSADLWKTPPIGKTYEVGSNSKSRNLGFIVERMLNESNFEPSQTYTHLSSKSLFHKSSREDCACHRYRLVKCKPGGASSYEENLTKQCKTDF